MKYIAVALLAAIVFCAIDHSLQSVSAGVEIRPKTEKYCYGYTGNLAFPCAWIPMQVEV